MLRRCISNRRYHSHLDYVRLQGPLAKRCFDQTGAVVFHAPINSMDLMPLLDCIPDCPGITPLPGILEQCEEHFPCIRFRDHWPTLCLQKSPFEGSQKVTWCRNTNSLTITNFAEKRGCLYIGSKFTVLRRTTTQWLAGCNSREDTLVIAQGASLDPVPKTEILKTQTLGVHVSIIVDSMKISLWFISTVSTIGVCLHRRFPNFGGTLLVFQLLALWNSGTNNEFWIYIGFNNM